MRKQVGDAEAVVNQESFVGMEPSSSSSAAWKDYAWEDEDVV
jgi:hypothetical protein